MRKFNMPQYGFAFRSQLRLCNNGSRNLKQARRIMYQNEFTCDSKHLQVHELLLANRCDNVGIGSHPLYTVDASCCTMPLKHHCSTSMLLPAAALSILTFVFVFFFVAGPSSFS